MTENILSEPAEITAGKLQVQYLKDELEAAQNRLQALQTNWKAQLDSGFQIEKDYSLAGLLAAKQRLEAAIDAAMEAQSQAEAAAEDAEPTPEVTPGGNVPGSDEAVAEFLAAEPADEEA
jgi:hypothetical protein